MSTALIADELMAARYQMALSLGFHIVLSCFGVALPAMIYVLHRRGLRHDDARRARTREEVGQGVGGALRGRCRVGHDPELRDGSALAGADVGRTAT